MLSLADLESLTSTDALTVAAVPHTDVLSAHHAAETTGKVAEIERRVEEMAQRASLRRKLAPAITSHGSDESLDSIIEQSAASLHRPPVSLAPSSGRLSRHNSGENRCRSVIGSCGAANKPRLTAIGASNKECNVKPALIGHQQRSSSCSAIHRAAVGGPPSALRCGWLSKAAANTLASTNDAHNRCKLSLLILVSSNIACHTSLNQ